MGMNEINNTWQELTEIFERMKNEPTPPPSVTIETANTVMDMLQGKEEFVDAVMEKTAEAIDEPFRPRNRAERRALDKATRRQKQKNRRMFADSIKETAEKLAYINMIEKVRELNNKIVEEGEKENEAAN